MKKSVLIAKSQVVVVNEVTHRVQIFCPDGVFVQQWGGEGTGRGLFRCPQSVAVRGNQVFVVDTHNNRVQVFTEDGCYVRTWGRQGTTHAYPRILSALGVQSTHKCQFNQPRGIATMRTGQVVIVDTTCMQMVE